MSLDGSIHSLPHTTTSQQMGTIHEGDNVPADVVAGSVIGGVFLGLVLFLMIFLLW